MVNLNPKDWLMVGIAAMLVAAGLWITVLRTQVSGLEDEVAKQSAVIEMQKIQLSSFVSAIDRQNEAISKLRVDMQQGVAEVAEKAKNVETRYNTVKVKDSTCEAKLQAYEDLLRVFAGRDR